MKTSRTPWKALAGIALLACGAACAQNVAPNVAVPFYTAGDFMTDYTRRVIKRMETRQE